MKSLKLLLGTIALIFGMNSVASWAANADEPASRKTSKDADTQKEKTPSKGEPTKANRGEPICFGGNDGK